MIFLSEFKIFVDEILKENSRNYKLSILEKYKDNESVKYFLNIVYNPYLIFGLSGKKLNKDIGDLQVTEFPNKSEDYVIFDYLKEHCTGTDIDIKTVQKYKETHISENCKELFDRVVTKDLQLGVDTKSINKIMPKLIHEFSVMLANKYFDNPKIVEGKSFALTTKIDGCRIIALKKNGVARFYTRQGQEYMGLVDLKKELEENFPDNICMDGELTLLDKGNLDSGEQYKATTKLCRTKDLEKHGLKMLVFDYMPADDFEAQNCDMVYEDRRAKLNYLFKGLNHPKRVYFSLLPVLYEGEDITMIEKILHEQVSNGEEGIMWNQSDAKYAFKRSNVLLKLKLFNDCEVKVIGFEEGTNKLAGTLGALICEYKNNTVRVGGGFSDAERKEIWAHKDEYLGQYLTVKFFEETYDSTTGLPSLRFPVFKGWRLKEDK